MRAYKKSDRQILEDEHDYQYWLNNQPVQICYNGSMDYEQLIKIEQAAQEQYEGEIKTLQLRLSASHQQVRYFIRLASQEINQAQAAHIEPTNQLPETDSPEALDMLFVLPDPA